MERIRVEEGKKKETKHTYIKMLSRATQAVRVGARWNSTASSAVLETTTKPVSRYA